MPISPFGIVPLKGEEAMSMWLQWFHAWSALSELLKAGGSVKCRTLELR